MGEADQSEPKRAGSGSSADELAREVYWAALPMADPQIGSIRSRGWSDLAVGWSELEATLRRDHGAGPLPEDPTLGMGSPAKRWFKRVTFRVLRPLMRRYDRITADLALLGLETSRELSLARQEVAALATELQVMRRDLEDFRRRVAPASLMEQEELPPLGDVVLELGARAAPHPRATIHHAGIAHSPWIDEAHDLAVFPWPWADASTDGIIAIDVFEHLRDVEVQRWLDECWRILKPGGLLVMRLPAWTNPLSYRDPTHHRVFHEESFSYWEPGHDLHESFGRYYFHGSDRWWKVRRVFREFEDLRFDLEKLPA